MTFFISRLNIILVVLFVLLGGHLLFGIQNVMAQVELPQLNQADSKHIFEPLSKIAPSGNAGLFVGVNRFDKDDSLSNLAYAVHDAIETAYVFVFELKLLPAENCVILLSGNPSDEESSKYILDHLSQLKNAGAKVATADRTEILMSFLQVKNLGRKDTEVLVCSFSSHGFEDRGDAYIMPSDGVKKLLQETAVPLRTIETNMDESKAGHRLLLVDACQERISARSSRNIAAPTTEAFVRAFNKSTGQAKLASCSPGQYSYEYRAPGGAGHGLFTQGFLRAVRGGARPDEAGIVRLGAVAEYVAEFASDWSSRNGRQEQTPFLKGPVMVRQLPLAAKADDLTTLLMTFQSQATHSVLSKKEKDELLNYLYESPLADPRDLQLVSYIRKYVAGDISGDLIGAYIDRDRARWAPSPQVPKPTLLNVPFSSNQATKKRQQWSQYLGIPETKTNSIGMKLQLVPPGSFTMGANERSNERAHGVTISKPFYVSNHEITLGQFRQFANATNFQTEQQRGNWPVRGWDASQRRFTRSSSFSWMNPGWPQQDDHPVVHVSWRDGQRFVEWLNQKEGVSYRFLTEAEWEYCCRAGTTSLYYVGNDQNQLVSAGNVLDQTGMQTFSSDSQFRQENQNIVIQRRDGSVFTSPVGRYSPNALGLYDFHGNICEWCHDWFTASYEQLSSEDPQGAASGSTRVARGGRFDTGGGLSRSFRRNQGEPSTTDMILGLRLAQEIKLKEN